MGAGGGQGAGQRAQREVLRAGTADGDQQLVPWSEGRGGNPTAGAAQPGRPRKGSAEAAGGADLPAGREDPQPVSGN